MSSVNKTLLFLCLVLLTGCPGGEGGNKPIIESFTATPNAIAVGAKSTLTWDVSGTEPITLSIDQGVGTVTGKTSIEVSPTASTTYTLTAQNSAGSVSKPVTLAVGETQADAYFATLPSWEEFSPPKSDQPPTPTGEAVAQPSTTEQAPKRDPNGNVRRDPNTGEILEYENVVYSCTETPYSRQDTPDKIIMYSPDANLLWPGNLLQGKTYRDGLGSLLPVLVKTGDRAPLTVSIADVFSPDATRTIENPDFGTVTKNIQEMIAKIQADGTVTPSDVSFEMHAFHSEKDFAAQLKASAKYFGFSASASGEYQQRKNETTVAVQFFQKMFTVTISYPQTPGGFFSKDFSQEDLDQLISSRQIGPDNIPVYLATITYGRMMTFTLSSFESEEKIRGTISAGFDGGLFGGSGKLSISQRKLLSEAKVSVFSRGGPAEATIDMIKSGNWGNYFSKDAPITSAAPLSYEFRNVSNNSTAKVTEFSEYNVRECTAATATEGFFDFQKAQTEFDMPIQQPSDPFVGDFNGDGITDIMLNHKDRANEVLIALGTKTGKFHFRDLSDKVPHFFRHPSSSPVSGSWGQYKTMIADVNGDGIDDIIWNRLNTLYVAHGLKTDKGVELKFLDGFTASGSTVQWELYEILTGDFDGNGSADVAWVLQDDTADMIGKSIVIAPTDTDSSGGKFAYYVEVDFPSFALPTSRKNYKVLPLDVNGDNADEFVWTYSYNTGAVGNFRHQLDAFAVFLNAYTPNLNDNNVILDIAPQYESNILGGRQNRDAFDDLIWVTYDQASVGLRKYLGFYYGRSDGQGGFEQIPGAFTRDGDSLPPTINFESYAGDVNGDGLTDIIMQSNCVRVDCVDSGEITLNSQYKFLRVAISSGNQVPGFDVGRPNQFPPFNGEIEWGSYANFVGDVNGDGFDDLVWVLPGKTPRVIVARAKVL
jgi:hypothetical protein